MKKFLLSFTVALAFVFYVIYDRGVSKQGQANFVIPTKQNNNKAASIQYKDGEYTGIVADAFYGPFQVKAIIQKGKIVDVEFLQYPNDRPTSTQINIQAMPYMRQEAIAAQSANVDIISGATQSAEAFQLSLASALAQAQ